jgi:hypothetical protein
MMFVHAIDNWTIKVIHAQKKRITVYILWVNSHDCC